MAKSKKLTFVELKKMLPKGAIIEMVHCGRSIAIRHRGSTQVVFGRRNKAKLEAARIIATLKEPA